MCASPSKFFSKPKIYCQNRKIWLISTPEEQWRQSILGFMLKEGGYPPSLIATEVAIGPRRRADIICYQKNLQGGLVPLLVIECKAHKLPLNILLQIKGYNYFLRAPFIAITSPQSSLWGWLQNQSYIFQEGFPYYKNLLQKLDILDK